MDDFNVSNNYQTPTPTPIQNNPETPQAPLSDPYTQTPQTPQTSYTQAPPASYPQSPQNPYAPIPQVPSNGMSLAAMILGICSIVFICCGGFAIGAVGIALALLSRGGGPMSTQAKVGLGLSIGGFVVSLLLTISMFFSQEFQNAFSEAMENPYGIYNEDFYTDFDYNFDDYNYDWNDDLDEWDDFPDFSHGFGDT